MPTLLCRRMPCADLRCPRATPLLVTRVGLKPTRPFDHYALNVACLPISASRCHGACGLSGRSNRIRNQSRERRFEVGGQHRELRWPVRRIRTAFPRESAPSRAASSFTGPSLPMVACGARLLPVVVRLCSRRRMRRLCLVGLRLQSAARGLASPCTCSRPLGRPLCTRTC